MRVTDSSPAPGLRVHDIHEGILAEGRVHRDAVQGDFAAGHIAQLADVERNPWRRVIGAGDLDCAGALADEEVAVRHRREGNGQSQCGRHGFVAVTGLREWRVIYWL